MTEHVQLVPHRTSHVSDQDGHLEEQPGSWSFVWLVVTVCLVLGAILFLLARDEIRQNVADRKDRKELLQEMKSVRRSLVEIQATRREMGWISQEVQRLDRDIRIAEAKR